MFRCLSIVALLVSFTSAAYAQPAIAIPPIRFSIVPLTVEEGFPLHIVLTDKLRFKLNEPVHGRIIDPVYAFDREVIPPGTEVLGKVTGFRRGGKWKRVSSILGGDFTPPRDPRITFDTLVFTDGTRMPIETSVDRGTDTLAQFAGDAKSPLAETGQVRAFTDGTKQPGKELLKGMLWNLAPYHPQSAPAGIRYKATLVKPLELGTAVIGAGSLDKIGAEPAAGSIIYARLETPLNSRTTKAGAGVIALLTRPLYDWDQLLIFPVGSRLSGEVVHVRRAGVLQHPGELAFNFTKIEPPNSIVLANWPTQNVQARLVGVEVAQDTNRIRINSEGAASIAQSKARFLAPALALVSLSGGFNNSSESFSRALVGAYSGSLIKRLLVGDAGFGLPAGIAGRMIPPIGIGLGTYGVGRSVVFNLLARGPEIDFPRDTPIEIRLDAAP